MLKRGGGQNPAWSVIRQREDSARGGCTSTARTVSLCLRKSACLQPFLKQKTKKTLCVSLPSPPWPSSRRGCLNRPTPSDWRPSYPNPPHEPISDKTDNSGGRTAYVSLSLLHRGAPTQRSGRFGPSPSLLLDGPSLRDAAPLVTSPELPVKGSAASPSLMTEPTTSWDRFKKSSISVTAAAFSSPSASLSTSKRCEVIRQPGTSKTRGRGGEGGGQRGVTIQNLR